MKIKVHYAKDTLEGDLEEYDLQVKYSMKDDRYPIDFKIVEEDGTYCAEVWGDDPHYVNVECEHPRLEFSDDECVGECPVCGQTCFWHWETTSDGNCIMKERVVDEWLTRERNNTGIIGKEIERLLERR